MPASLTILPHLPSWTLMKSSNSPSELENASTLHEIWNARAGGLGFAGVLRGIDGRCEVMTAPGLVTHGALAARRRGSRSAQADARAISASRPSRSSTLEACAL